MKKFLSIIIPCYNEAENIKQGVLSEVDNYLNKQKFSWEVIISDDESTDDSWNLVEKFIEGKNNYIHLKNKHGGKPFAVRNGLEKAIGEWVLFTDMDQATPIEEFDKIYSLTSRYNIIIGSRGTTRKNFPLYRKIASFAFLNFRRLLILPKIIDTQCGFKAFKRDIALKIFSLLEVFSSKVKAKGWRVSAYDVELIFLANKLGYEVAEVPVKWADRDISANKKRSFIKESKAMLMEIFRVRVNDLLGEYEFNK